MLDAFTPAWSWTNMAPSRHLTLIVISTGEYHAPELIAGDRFTTSKLAWCLHAEYKPSSAKHLYDDDGDYEDNDDDMILALSRARILSVPDHIQTFFLATYSTRTKYRLRSRHALPPYLKQSIMDIQSVIMTKEGIQLRKILEQRG
ncbi:hypothetical protein N7462_004746 [Penicillium macrosclerotiorum]|uniref:uncharacterized protein n=1 Tax=Penicillium macrosclerotiorum TaxID=303699 RepID=UPI0025483F6D|nr:uncharacterized protein N7462_004746 [Penicillium macrosclerotiorum]KAJ5690354.1 hypothetical protein N7462_004746 [Penicillium macrosclerotiorum]